METIKKAVELVGLSPLAKTIGVTVQAICLWRSGSTQLMARHAAAIEDATQGQVTAYAIGKECAELPRKKK